MKKDARLKDVFRGLVLNFRLEDFVKLPDEWQVVGEDGVPLESLDGVETVMLVGTEDDVPLEKGQRISVMWNVDKKKRWCKAVVEGYNADTKTHRVRYLDDGVVADEPLHDRDWKKLKR